MHNTNNNNNNKTNNDNDNNNSNNNDNNNNINNNDRTIHDTKNTGHTYMTHNIEQKTITQYKQQQIKQATTNQASNNTNQASNNKQQQIKQ